MGRRCYLNFLNVSSFQSLTFFFLYLPPDQVISFGNLCFSRELDISCKILNNFIRYSETKTHCFKIVNFFCLVLLYSSYFFNFERGPCCEFQAGFLVLPGLHCLGIEAGTVFPGLHPSFTVGYQVLYFLKS